MAYTQANLAALQEAFASGVRTVVFEGRSITYATTEELQRAISAVQNALTSGSGTRRRQTRLMSSKGF